MIPGQAHVSIEVDHSKTVLTISGRQSADLDSASPYNARANVQTAVLLPAHSWLVQSKERKRGKRSPVSSKCANHGLTASPEARLKRCASFLLYAACPFTKLMCTWFIKEPSTGLLAKMSRGASGMSVDL